MARVKVAEYRAKKMLIADYQGAAIFLADLDKDAAQLNQDINYVVKVDQGVKKRGKQGLVKLNVSKDQVPAVVRELAKKGYSRFIAEPMLAHDDHDEHYISFERTREGIQILYSKHGGIDIENAADSVQKFSPDNTPLSPAFIKQITDTMDREHLAFVEINPLVIQGDKYSLLDAAVLADSAGQFQSSWDDRDIVDTHQKTTTESSIAELNNNSPAAFSFRILNPDGAIWLLLSGGGASITIADEAANLNRADVIGNYGEYSGGPSTEESYLYATQVIQTALSSKATKKALVVAGGVANFTDVAKTFRGLIQAFEANKAALQKAHFKVFVRRGGPNEAEGLALITRYLKDNQLFGSVHGSDTTLTEVIHEALEVIDA